MRGPALLLTLLLVAASPAAAAGQQQAADSAAAQTVQLVPETPVDRLTREVAAQLRCPVCQGLSIQDSPSPLAQEMRDLIREKLAAGQSPEEVKAYFVGRYGEWILLEPEATGFNLAVYVLPAIAVVIGTLLVVLAARRWMARTPSAAPPPKYVDDPDLAPWEESAPR